MGTTYLIEEEKPIKGFAYLLELKKNENPILCISKQLPEIVRRKYEIDDAIIVWLSTKLGREHIDPRNLGKLTAMIHQFVEDHEGSIVFLDGLESLMINNNFMEAARFLEVINESVMLHSSLLIVSINPNAFDKRELSLLERHVEVIR